MYPIFFTIGPVAIYSHGVMVAIGIAAGAWIIYRLSEIEGLKTNKLFDNILYSLLAGFLGARILYVILYYNQFPKFIDTLAIWNGGMVSYGGIIAGLGVGIYLLKKQNQDIWRWLDIIIVGLFLGWGIGRIGCFLAGDLVGRATSSPVGLVFSAIDEQKRHPVALYETIISIIIFGFLYFLSQTRNLKYGFITFSGLILFFLLRFAVDFFREYNNFILHLSFSQVFSLVAVLILAGFFSFRIKKEIHG